MSAPLRSDSNGRQSKLLTFANLTAFFQLRVWRTSFVPNFKNWACTEPWITAEIMVITMIINNTWYLSSKLDLLEEKNIENNLILSEIFTSKEIMKKTVDRRKRELNEIECLWVYGDGKSETRYYHKDSCGISKWFS